MVEKISRDICLIKFRKFPLCEYDKELDDNIYYYPKIHSVYWIKLESELEKNSQNILSNEITSLFKELKIDNTIFLGEINKPWVSKLTESRKDFKLLTKAIEYFKNNKIENRFNGGVKVNFENLEEFIYNFYIITECDGGFFDFNFMDENENYIFHIHYSGELKIITLNEKSNDIFLKKVSKTKFFDSMMENANRI